MDSFNKIQSGDSIMLKYFDIDENLHLDNFVNGKVAHDSVGTFNCFRQEPVRNNTLSSMINRVSFIVTEYQNNHLNICFSLLKHHFYQ